MRIDAVHLAPGATALCKNTARLVANRTVPVGIAEFYASPIDTLTTTCFTGRA